MNEDGIQRASMPSDIRARRSGEAHQLTLHAPPPHPAPEVAATTDIPIPLPMGVRRFKVNAERTGWTVVPWYFRGTWMYAKGKPGVVTDVLALRMARAPAQRAVAVWAAPVVPGRHSEWAFDLSYTWDDKSPPLRVPLMQSRKDPDVVNLMAIIKMVGAS